MAQFGTIIHDFADLARAGFTPEKMKELLTLEKADPAPAEEPPAGTGADDKPQPATGDPKQEPEKGPEPGNAGESDNIEALKAKLEEAQNALKAAQEANTRKDVSGDPEDSDKALKEIFASYT